ncbi:unnamed protein product [Camellia sinensis]
MGCCELYRKRGETGLLLISVMRLGPFDVSFELEEPWRLAELAEPAVGDDGPEGNGVDGGFNKHGWGPAGGEGKVAARRKVKITKS